MELSESVLKRLERLSKKWDEIEFWDGEDSYFDFILDTLPALLAVCKAAQAIVAEDAEVYVCPIHDCHEHVNCGPLNEALAPLLEEAK